MMVSCLLPQDDYTALHIAVQHGKPLVVQTLLGFGANVQLKGGKVCSNSLFESIRKKEVQHKTISEITNENVKNIQIRKYET